MTVISFRSKDDLDMHNRTQLIERLATLYEKGYRYMARDAKSEYIYLFSEKPKKYKETNDYYWWGYSEKQIVMSNILPAYPIRNVDVELSKPMLISEFISKSK